MDLNSINLSPDLIENLYGDSLKYASLKGVKKSAKEITVPTVETPLVHDPKWKSLGNNQKSILIVVKNPGMPYLPDPDKEFLSTILKACKLGMDDVAIVNLADYENANYKELTGFFKSRIVMLFDIEPASFGLPMKFPYYQIQPFAGNSFLYAPSLEILKKEIEEKKKLWSSLKRIFNV